MFTEKSLVIGLVHCPLVAENYNFPERNMKHLFVSIYVKHLYLKVSNIEETFNKDLKHTPDSYLDAEEQQTHDEVGCWGSSDWHLALSGILQRTR